MYNILLACDTLYYTQWAINCIRSIQHYNPWIKITAVVVNPVNVEELPGVRYVYEDKKFTNDDEAVGYYQALRFIKVPELYKDNELVLTLDVDTICTRSFTPVEFDQVCRKIHILKHHKENRWLAGFVSYGLGNFRHRYKDALLQKDTKDWTFGWDQEVLNALQSEYNYEPIRIGGWVSFGKGVGTFLTLKGTQKVSGKYLPNYLEKLEKINSQKL